MFKRTWWRFWRHAWEADVPGLEERTVILPELANLEATVLSWDMAFKKTSTSDFVAGGVWSRHGANLYLRDLRWRRMSFTESLEELRAQSIDYPEATAKLVEDAANGPAILDTLRDEIEGLIPVAPLGGKEARASASSPRVQAGNVILPLWADWRDKYIEEHAAFPVGAHDDAVDQQSQAILYFQSGYGDWARAMEVAF